MQITVLSVNVEKVKTAKGFYEKAEVAYKGEDGKVSGKNVMSFVNQKVFDTLKGCSGGEVLEVTTEKDDKGYWQWTAIGKGEVGQAPAVTTQTKAVATPKSTYETPEERAQKQIYIVRQSSISSAIEYFRFLKELQFVEHATIEELLKTAKEFEDYVFAKAPAKFDDNFPGDEDQVL